MFVIYIYSTQRRSDAEIGISTPDIYGFRVNVSVFFSLKLFASRNIKLIVFITFQIFSRVLKVFFDEEIII